jgi:hypothetical protein
MKTQKIVMRFFLLCLTVGVLAACADHQISPAKVTTPDSVKFSLNIVPIFNGSCAKPTCHVTGVQQPDLTTQNAYTSLIYFGYVDTDYPDQSILYQKITTGDMKDHATDADRALILKWIQQGAQNN